MSQFGRALLATVVLCACSLNVSAAESGAVKKDQPMVDSACQSDAATAGCSGEVLGRGLLKCMRKYKREHKGFQFSSGCEQAMQQYHQDNQSRK